MHLVLGVCLGVVQSQELVRAVKSCNHDELKVHLNRMTPEQVRSAKRRLPLLNYVFIGLNTSEDDMMQCAKTLVNKGTDINGVFRDPSCPIDKPSTRTVLYQAVAVDSPRLLDRLVRELNADVNIQQFGGHILGVAVKHKAYRAARYLATLDCLDVAQLRVLYSADTALQEFVRSTPPEQGVLQNIVVELVRGIGQPGWWKG